MTSRIARLRSHLTFSNVAAGLALFVALGGTSYAAIALPRDSVGAKQLRKGAVRSSDIRNDTIQVADISSRARGALGGQQGPAGPSGTPAIGEYSRVSAGGGSSGTDDGVGHDGGTNLYSVRFKRNVSNCAYSATLAAVQAGPVLEEPPAGRITVASGGGDQVVVKTFDVAGNPVSAPFHLIVAC